MKRKIIKDERWMYDVYGFSEDSGDGVSINNVKWEIKLKNIRI